MINPYALNQRGSAHIAVIGVVAIAILGAVGFLFWNNVIDKPAEKSDVKLVREVKAQQISLPAEWKKFESKKYGVSLSTPSDWEVHEQDNSTSDVTPNPSQHSTLYIISVCEPGCSSSLTPTSYITVVDSQLDETVKKETSSLTTFNVTDIKTATLSWHGHNAIQITGKLGGSSKEFSQFYVQIGKYTYILPDTDHPESTFTSDGFDLENLKIYVSSIRVKES